MKTKQSKEAMFTSNKSNTMEKTNSNLVIQTHLENSFDTRWAEIKIEGKNIASRSNHASVVFGTFLYIHGGYDVDRGIIPDFHSIDLSEDCQQYIWKKLPNTFEGKQIKLKGHSGVVYKQNMYLFGGQVQTNESSNIIYSFDFVTKAWKAVNPSGVKVPKVDCHCALVFNGKMYVYGGYICDEAEYMKDIFGYDFQKGSWEIVYKSQKGGVEPQGRSNFSMIEFQNNLWMFGGTNGSKTQNDLWKFDLTLKKWQKIQNKDTPQPRRGHSMLKFEDYIFMFGGIQDITKQKNDIYIYQPLKSQWSKIHTTTNSIYECSPTLKKENKSTNKSPDLISPVRISPQKNSEKGENAMKKILNENKQKKFMERKKQLLKQFAQKPDSQNTKKRDLSPTTESMVKTLETIGNQQSNKKQLKQEIIYDETHRFIIGKKPCARDGQSVNLFNQRMYIFGGDRHLMAFNDLYRFDLGKGVKSLELYRH